MAKEEELKKKSVQLNGGQINHLSSLCCARIAELQRHSRNAGVPVGAEEKKALKELLDALGR